MARKETETTASTDDAQQMWPVAALDVALMAAHMASPLHQTDDGRTFGMVPDGFAFEDVTDPDRAPRFIEVTNTVDDRKSLSAYVNRFRRPGTVLFADVDAGTVTAYIDYHESFDKPDRCRHVARLQLRQSEEFKRWAKFEGGGQFHDQSDFAAFLEENANDVYLPEPSVLVEISRDLELVQGCKFRQSTRLESGDRALIFEAETQVKGEVVVPREITLSIPIYAGEDADQLRAAFRYRGHGGGIAFGIEWRRVEYQRLARFQEIANLVADETGAPVYFGR